jgi:DNA-binding LacI/PurR family transcriptional regulator
MCFGDSDMSHLLSPALSCVNQPTRELGITAVHTILDAIKSHEKQKESHVVIPAGLTLRETCKARAPQMKTVV